MKYTAVIFSTGNTEEQNEILIALLANIGFEGFEEAGNLLQAFIKEEEFNETELKAIAESMQLSYTVDSVEQQNWNAAWESSFEPVIINDFAAIRAHFHQPVPNVQHEIVITPKMSFGTGHHATTYLMMEQMSGINFIGKSVLDFGTGTGVLAILAEKMGATDIVGIDNDDWSIENAEENLQRNQATHIQINKAEEVVAGKKYDIILANINLNVITANMRALAESCATGATVLLSGFLNTDIDQIKTALEANNLQFISFTRKKDWICVLATV
jgi:ribosomal protein L11 methyltransferase